VIQVFVLLAGMLVVLVNILTDLLYAWLDPRIRLA
jgi:ABC-type dipeptide/oligopeptide/nickel transport system permease component